MRDNLLGELIDISDIFQRACGDRVSGVGSVSPARPPLVMLRRWGQRYVGRSSSRACFAVVWAQGRVSLSSIKVYHFGLCRISNPYPSSLRTKL